MKQFLEQITIKAVAEGFDKVRQQVESVQKPLDQFSKSLDSIGKKLTVSLTAPLSIFAGLAIREFANAEKAIAKVENQLKLTGDAIGLTFNELDQASKQLQQNSIFGDDEILGKVTSQLLRVSGLTKDSFLEAQQVVVDLASALDTDLQSAALQVSKALESPADGLSALSRVGIRFSKEQENLIKSLVQTGREAEAQGIILDVLRGKFEGTAEAISQTSFGSLAQLKNAFNDLAEVIGGRLFGLIQPLVERLTTMLQNLQQLNPAVLDFAIKVGAVAAALGPLSIALSVMVSNITLLVNPVVAAIGVLVGITSALDALAQKFTFVSRIINGFNALLFSMLGMLTKVLHGIVKFVSLLVTVDSAIAGAFGLDRVAKFGEAVTDTLNSASKAIGEFSENLSGTAGLALEKAFTGETAEVISVNDLFGDITTFMNDMQQKGVEAGTKFGTGIKTGVSSVNPFAVGAAQAADKLDAELNRIRDQFNTLTETGQIFTNSFTNALSSIQSGTKSLSESFKDLGKTIVNSLFNAAIQNAFTKLFQNLGGAFTFGGVASGAPNITGQTFATGGMVNGPGSSTSDSIMARLSNGEFVMSAKAVQHWGAGMLQQMNALGKGFFPRNRPGFPSFAEGGQASGGSGVTVNLVNNSSTPLSARSNSRIDGRQIIVDTILEDARVNGPISQSMQNTYGVRR